MLTRENWAIIAIAVGLLVLIIVIAFMIWRRRRAERFQRYRQLDSVYNSRERRNRGD